MNRIADMNLLLDCEKLCGKGSDFKESYQRFDMNDMLNCRRLKRNIRAGVHEPGDYHEFILSERGRKRPVRAPGVRDRVVQKAINKEIILPELKKRIIYDNTASIKDRGVEMARERFKRHLREHIRKYGLNGYVVFLDCSKYFDNIDHKMLKEDLKGFTDNKDEQELINRYIDSFRQDVSWMSDEEYEEARNGVYNSLTSIGKAKTGERYLEKGLNLGTEIAQSGGIYYLNSADMYYKTIRAIRGYGRYQDDTYVFTLTKEEAVRIADEAEENYKRRGIVLNRRKTIIQPIRKPMRWLKIRYIPTETGHITEVPDPSSFRRERQRARGYVRKIKHGEMSLKDVQDAYTGWRNAIKKYDCHDALKRMDMYFKKQLRRLIMTSLKFTGSTATYPGEVLEMGGDAIVLRFKTLIPETINGSTITVIEGGKTQKTYKGYTTVYQMDGMDVIMTNSGRVNEITYSDDEIESIRSTKLMQMAANCTDAIYYGVDVNNEHYSMEETDQINLQNAYAAVQAGAAQYPYHADGELCRMHTAEEITAIAAAMTSHKLYHTTYCNHLNTWIKRETSAANIGGIYYGAALPDDLKESMEAIINATSSAT